MLPSIKMVKGKQVEFSNGRSESFDAIVFATGFKSTVMKWLQVSLALSLSGVMNDDVYVLKYIYVG